MDTRTYLSQVKNLNKRIVDCIKETERWHDIAVSTSGGDFANDKVQSTPKSDKLGDAVAMAVDYQIKAKNEAVRLTELRYTIIEQIKGLSEEKNGLYYNLLYGYYVDGKNFNSLAVSENYSFRQTKRYFDNAIDAFSTKYAHLYKDIV